MQDQIIILDFGSQYTQLIARRIRGLHVYCEIYPFFDFPPLTKNIKGIILSGGPCSVHDKNFPSLDLSLFRSIPILGICYGAQLIALTGGGQVTSSRTREYGKANLILPEHSNPLFQGFEKKSQVWMSHSDTIVSLPGDYQKIASTSSVDIAAFYCEKKRQYGIQFHPEVTHTQEGEKLLRNFVLAICSCSEDWHPSSFIETTVRDLAIRLGDEQVVMALSGGVDSTVAAMLIHKAIGDRLHGIFIDNGLLRKGEFQQVLDLYKKIGLNIKGIRAGERFYEALRGLENPEAKRKAIGKTFITIFEEEAAHLSNVSWLGQGTIYPDVIESSSKNGSSATIKSHHNVGGLPEKMNMRLVEPIRMLFKDEVRMIGKALHINADILKRHPFPGPGLAIRIVGEVTQDKAKILREADAIFIAHLHRTDLYDKIWQAGTILLPVRSVGVMGDDRIYDRTVVLRAVTSIDGMTADWAQLPHDFLREVSSAIMNGVKGISRVVYDISSKPPATIEWE